jgi:hypothetical protein
MTLTELTGGRLETISHIQSLLDKQTLFTWENYGDAWVVDHIKALARMVNYNDPDEKKRFCHHSNLAPLKGQDNCSKKY